MAKAPGWLISRQRKRWTHKTNPDDVRLWGILEKYRIPFKPMYQIEDDTGWLWVTAYIPEIDGYIDFKGTKKTKAVRIVQWKNGPHAEYYKKRGEPNAHSRRVIKRKAALLGDKLLQPYRSTSTEKLEFIVIRWIRRKRYERDTGSSGV